MHMPGTWPSVPGMSSGGRDPGTGCISRTVLFLRQVQLRCNLTRVSSGFQVTWGQGCQVKDRVPS